MKYMLRKGFLKQYTGSIVATHQYTGKMIEGKEKNQIQEKQETQVQGC